MSVDPTARRRPAPLALALAAIAVVALLWAAAAAAAAPRTEVGEVRHARTPSGPVLLVPVTYPIELAGRAVRLGVVLRDGAGNRVRGWTVRARANAGPLRAPDRRQRFTFVHRVPTGTDDAANLRRGAVLSLTAVARVDADRDGRAELGSVDRE